MTLESALFFFNCLIALALWAVIGLSAVLAAAPPPTLNPPAGEQQGRWLGIGLLGVGMGWGLIPALAFFGSLMAGRPVTWVEILLAATGMLAVSVAVLLARHGSRIGQTLQDCGRSLAACVAAHRMGLGFAGLAFSLHFVRWDAAVAPLVTSCVNEVALVAVGVLHHDGSVLGTNISDSRLGNPAVIAGFVAQFHGLGQRLLAAACGGLVAAGGYVAGWNVAHHKGIALTSAALLAFNPWLLAFPLVDENFLTLAFAAAWMPTLLARPVPWLALGLLAGLTLGMREPLWLAMPALVLAAAHQGWRQALTLLGALAVSTLPYHVHHVLAMGSVLSYEGMGQIPAHPHSIGPLRFDWQGLMNWPLHDTIVRTPHNPFPTFVLWPLWALDRLGTALCAVVGVGAVALVVRSRPQGLVQLGLFLPPYAILAVQENWDDPNKMGVMLILFVPVAVWAAAGLQAVGRAPLRLGGLVVALAALLVPAASALRAWSPPADPRYMRLFGEDAVEAPELLAMDRLRLTTVAPWPDFSRLNDYSDFWSGRKLTALADDLAQPDLGFRRLPWGWHVGEPPHLGKPVVLELDLTEPPWQRTNLVQVVPGNPESVDFDLTGSASVQMASPVRVPWTVRPLTLALTPGGAAVTGVMLAFGHHAQVRARAPDLVRRGIERFSDVQFDYHWLLMADGHDGAGIWRERPSRPAGARIRLRVPQGGLTLAFSVSARAVRTVVWRGVVHADRVALGAPRFAIHN